MGCISMYLSSMFISFIFCTISCQTQGTSLLISHEPPTCEPPQGPLKRLFAHRATGQSPRVLSRTQLPHPWHISFQTPCSSEEPKKVVLTAGTTYLFRYISATVWTPQPQAIEMAIS